MRLRTRHLACLLLLLSSLSATAGSAQSTTGLTPGGRYISMLLSQRSAASVSSEPRATGNASYKIVAAALPAAARTRSAAAWTMRPPAAHASALQAATSRLS
ncbi:MAG: hypothetical protein V4555_20695 [Acidobacteriota bacterium]